MLSVCNIEGNHQRISEIKPFISQCNWKDIDFPSHQKYWKKFEQNNKTIALNILFVPYNTKTIECAYKSKYNRKHKNKVILLMITDGEKWHYLTVKILSALLREIISNHNGDFYCLNYFRSYRTDGVLKKHEKHGMNMIVIQKFPQKTIKYENAITEKNHKKFHL